MPLPSCTRIGFYDRDKAKTLLANGWREIEVLETWYGRTKWELGDLIEAGPQHREKLMKIARAVFTHDRLHKDPLVDKKDADEFKAKCISDAIDDYDRRVFINRNDPTAFLSIWAGGTGVAQIDLVASMTRGAAETLIKRAVVKLLVHDLEANTQSTNEKARRLYAGLGMRVIRRQRTFHK